MAPAVISRDAVGRAILRAVRLTSPLRLDGRLDEDVYATTASFSDFFQQDPVEGVPATERTEGWILFDERAVYDNLAVNTYWARSRTGGVAGDDVSYRAQLDSAGDRYGVLLERLAIGDEFNPDIGYVRRRDIRAPRPIWSAHA